MSAAAQSSPLERVCKISPSKCKICKRALDPNGRSLKNCNDCLDKKKRINDESQKKQREQELQSAVNILVNNAPASSSTKDAPDGKIMKDKHSKKRKAEEPADDREVVQKRAKDFLDAVVPANDAPSATSKPVQPEDSTGDEYQTASHLYRGLKRLKLSSQPPSSNPRVRFHGKHSIVVDPDIDNTKRAALVARDVSKLGRLSFNHRSTISPPILSASFLSLSFRCTCSEQASETSGQGTVKKPTPMNSSAGKDTSKKTKGDLKRKDAEAAGSQTKACKGVIEVTAENDSSNQYMSGQKISIRVWH
ncbi:hypothetical protein D9758_003604 [Tetrapyrgos nigripes]|uniref:Uncharacterized protein n=1 Tax=Tetrapyrgos nigripes TaxID=182062 RepID=A0A8H5GMK9_9AGAR|nr:hypothetical protein D9758_003604 [Tetrapyrgos nigripes]